VAGTGAASAITRIAAATARNDNAVFLRGGIEKGAIGIPVLRLSGSAYSQPTLDGDLI
jgi:hypothetical protein